MSAEARAKITNDALALAAAAAAEDDGKSADLAARLVGQALCDLNRIADALERLASPPVQPPVDLAAWS